MKPTPGLVPLPGGAGAHWHGLTASGPIARTVADAALALDVVAGTRAYRGVRPPERPLHIAFSARHPMLGARTAAAVRAARGEAVRALREAGHELVAAVAETGA